MEKLIKEVIGDELTDQELKNEILTPVKKFLALNEVESKIEGGVLYVNFSEYLNICTDKTDETDFREIEKSLTIEVRNDFRIWANSSTTHSPSIEIVRKSALDEEELIADLNMQVLKHVKSRIKYYHRNELLKDI